MIATEEELPGSAFEYELICIVCSFDAGDFIAADPYGVEPRACPRCGGVLRHGRVPEVLR